MKVILITGTTSGFGKLIAEGLVKKGHRVYGTCLPCFDADRDAFGFPILELDITDDTSVDSCVTELIEAEGRIDVLINNAGVSIAGALEDTTVAHAVAGQWAYPDDGLDGRARRAPLSVDLQLRKIRP